MHRIIMIGAGIGGLTTAALLAKAGLDVTVLEAHVYPGGCAGTFYHQGYRFDAGATLAAGFDPDGGMTRLGKQLGIAWPVELAEAALAVHLPDGAVVTRWTDPGRWEAERRAAFGAAGERFWRWQERTADLLWRAALDGIPWPPQRLTDLASLASAGFGIAGRAPGHLPGLALDALRPAAARLAGLPDRLRRYVDGQLLISAQATGERANALYAAAALDMPRRGVAHVRGGIGKLADTLALAVQRHGGQVCYRQRVTRVAQQPDGSYHAETHKGDRFEADMVVFNLPPHNAAALLGDDAPPKLRSARLPADGWGAFMTYVGLDAAGLPTDLPLHHQVLVREPLGEGNSIFLSLVFYNERGDMNSNALMSQGDRIALGRTGLRVSPLGLGTWQWGDTMFWGYGKGYAESEIRAAFETSLAAGITSWARANQRPEPARRGCVGKIGCARPFAMIGWARY